MAAASEGLEVDIYEPSEEWRRVVEELQVNLSRSLRKVLLELQYIPRHLVRPRKEERRAEGNRQ